MQYVNSNNLACPLPYSLPYSLNHGSADKGGYIGLSRCHCAQLFIEQNLPTALFATWMLVPKLGILLTFRHQCCVAVEAIAAIDSNDDDVDPAYQHNPVTRQYKIRG